MTSGITSQFGYLFQRYTFIQTVLNNAAMGVYFVYEGADDIDISDAESENILLRMKKSNGEHIQVKSGEITKECWAKVIGNWILMEDYESSLTLFCEKEMGFDIADESVVDRVYQYYLDGKEKSNKSIFKRVNSKLFEKQTQDEIKELIHKISSECEVKVMSIDEIKESLEDLFVSIYCSDIKVYENAKHRRFERFVEYFMKEMDDSISEKKQCMITYQKIMEMIGGVKQEISDDKYEINITELKKKKRTIAEKLCRNNKIREVKQLRLVKDDINFVAGELVKELLYKEFREVYSKGGAEISNIEETAYTNYEDARFELSDDVSSQELFIATTRKPIEAAIMDSSPLYRNGCYVYLTGDDAEEGKQISWGKVDE